jgi:two-component system, OmpR family, sensor kinase
VEVSAGTQLVAIKVIDHGPGIPAELRPRLFERFVRGDSKENEATGTGLGLAIVKGLVEAHAGTVALEDSPDGVGAIFRFTLPLAPAAPA